MLLLNRGLRLFSAIFTPVLTNIAQTIDICTMTTAPNVTIYGEAAALYFRKIEALSQDRINNGKCIIPFGNLFQ